MKNSYDKLAILIPISVFCVSLGLPNQLPASSSTVSDEQRIVGGRQTTIEEHPYQVCFVVNESYFCGGFIVSENYILTAGHCAQEVDPKTVELRAGSTYRKNGTVIPIAEVTPHPEYNDPAYDKDVAVMKTVNPIKFSDKIKPIPLPPRGRPMVAGSDIVVSGWGRTLPNAPTLPNVLMDVQISVEWQTPCYFSYYNVMTNNMFCAGSFMFGGQGTCQGDSGGAATQDGMAVGIVSFGRICAQPASPSVFANIASPAIWDFIANCTGLM